MLGLFDYTHQRPKFDRFVDLYSECVLTKDLSEEFPEGTLIDHILLDYFSGMMTLNQYSQGQLLDVGRFSFKEGYINSRKKEI
jgi:hypothetical protein